MTWDDLEMELERGNRDFERRMEEASGEIRERLEGAVIRAVGEDTSRIR